MQPGIQFDAALRAILSELDKTGTGILIDVFKEPIGYFVTNCLQREIAAGRCNEGHTVGS